LDASHREADCTKGPGEPGRFGDVGVEVNSVGLAERLFGKFVDRLILPDP